MARNVFKLGLASLLMGAAISGCGGNTDRDRIETENRQAYPLPIPGSAQRQYAKKPEEKNPLVGTWRAIREEVRGEPAEESAEFYFRFNKDETYVSRSRDFETTGKYKVFEDGKILFYNSPQELDAYLRKAGSFNEGWIELNGDNELRLSLPKFPKETTYKRIVEN